MARLAKKNIHKKAARLMSSYSNPQQDRKVGSSYCRIAVNKFSIFFGLHYIELCHDLCWKELTIEKYSIEKAHLI